MLSQSFNMHIHCAQSFIHTHCLYTIQFPIQFIQFNYPISSQQWLSQQFKAHAHMSNPCIIYRHCRINPYISYFLPIHMHPYISIQLSHSYAFFAYMSMHCYLYPYTLHYSHTTIFSYTHTIPVIKRSISVRTQDTCSHKDTYYIQISYLSYICISQIPY